MQAEALRRRTNFLEPMTHEGLSTFTLSEAVSDEIEEAGWFSSDTLVVRASFPSGDQVDSPFLSQILFNLLDVNHLLWIWSHTAVEKSCLGVDEESPVFMHLPMELSSRKYSKEMLMRLQTEFGHSSGQDEGDDSILKTGKVKNWNLCIEYRISEMVALLSSKVIPRVGSLPSSHLQLFLDGVGGLIVVTTASAPAFQLNASDFLPDISQDYARNEHG
ncbi:hypothetical protein E5288_WYG009478 [Bos mutus]|uniref:Uncharacterized protein n=1 Tax=Bos mutus TaxID=72004 RepID=A0A6B0RQ86_9CETA|nr:hypothetical protein [Bos mutus]